MANIFALILVIATLVTGLLWCLNRFIFSPKREYQATVQTATINNQTNNKILKKTKTKSNWLEAGASIFPILTIVLIVRSFIYEPFQLPSGSMMPTLLIGDFILVKKFAYGIKDPIYQKTIIEIGHPKRGDIVVFKYPDDPRLYYIKRVIGLPRDKIIYNPETKEITVQPGCNWGINCDKRLPITYSNIWASNFIQTFTDRHNNEMISSLFEISKNDITENSIRLVERKETLGDVTHRILIIPIEQDQLNMYYQQPGQQLATWIVPPGQYFMMGDNRDNSSDSRYWGFVPEENVIGKATAIWMSFEKQENKWPIRLHFNRIGRIY